jgi:hypothetical protein
LIIFAWYLLTHLLNCLGFRIWDLSLERDAEEEAEFRAKMKEQANAPEDLPPQLLFVHQVVQLNYPHFIMMALDATCFWLPSFVGI